MKLTQLFLAIALAVCVASAASSVQSMWLGDDLQPGNPVTYIFNPAEKEKIGFSFSGNNETLEGEDDPTALNNFVSLNIPCFEKNETGDSLWFTFASTKEGANAASKNATTTGCIVASNEAVPLCGSKVNATDLACVDQNGRRQQGSTTVWISGSKDSKADTITVWSTNYKPSSGSSGLPIWVYIAIAAGGLVLIVLIIVIVVCCKRASRRSGFEKI